MSVDPITAGLNAASELLKVVNTAIPSDEQRALKLKARMPAMVQAAELRKSKRILLQVNKINRQLNKGKITQAQAEVFINHLYILLQDEKTASN